MATLQVFGPDAEAETLFGEIPGLRQTAVPVVGFDGPDGHLGPEAAGAVLFLHMTMVDEERTRVFWKQVALTCRAAAEWPGFIRLIAFFDGFANNALAFWRTVESAQTFAQSRTHLDAIQDMYKHNFEYTHYAGLWQPVSPRTREFYCDRCGAETLMPAERCSRCGNEIADVFRPATRIAADGHGDR